MCAQLCDECVKPEIIRKHLIASNSVSQHPALKHWRMPLTHRLALFGGKILGTDGSAWSAGRVRRRGAELHGVFDTVVLVECLPFVAACGNKKAKTFPMMD